MKLKNLKKYLERAYARKHLMIFHIKINEFNKQQQAFPKVTVVTSEPLFCL
jgi:hypothetical protein